MKLRRTVGPMPSDAEFLEQLQQWRIEAQKDGIELEIIAAEITTLEDMRKNWIIMKENDEFFAKVFPGWYAECDCSQEDLIRNGCRCGGI